MRRFASRARQQGVALMISLILLTILTVLGVYAASTGALQLRMVGNMQESFDSFQSAEAGIAAVLSLVRSGPDPFAGDDEPDPFNGAGSVPLDQLNDGAGSVNVNIVMQLKGATCPRLEEGYSVGLIDCDHYRIESLHTSADARTKLDEGIVKPVIGNASL
ncbi:MAG: hypothetical protein IPH83_19925 [Gammaproteobacteria bacterium]|nr:hypothetical protein [Gammaproteobacteria bacterium]